MSQSAVITGVVTITAKSINGDSVASVFNNVLNLTFDYYKGTIRVVDAILGEAFFGLTLVTTVTYTVAGTTTTVVVS
jgi:hypothetical protein